MTPIVIDARCDAAAKNERGKKAEEKIEGDDQCGRECSVNTFCFIDTPTLVARVGARHKIAPRSARGFE